MKTLSVGLLMFFESFTFHALDKEYLTALFKLCPILCCQIISEHLSENRVTLWPMVVKLRCIKLFAVFLEHPANSVTDRERLA